MARNVLFELREIKERVIDEDAIEGGATYSVSTKELFLRVADWIREGSFVTADTQKFACQNYMVEQADLSPLWKRLHSGDSERASSTFRLACSNVNAILSGVFPEDMLTYFLEEDSSGLARIAGIMDLLETASIPIDEVLGLFVCGKLDALPSTYEKYEPSECTEELRLLYDISDVALKERFAKCDMKKLSYLYGVLREAPYRKGTVNKTRLRFVEALMGLGVSADAISVGTDESVTDDAVNTGTEEITTNALDERTGLDAETLNFIKSQTDGVFYAEDNIINPDVLKLFATISRYRLQERLSDYDISDVAYAYNRLFVEKDEDTLTLFKKYLYSDSDNVGEYKLLPSVTLLLERLSEGVEPSEQVNNYAIQVISDYLEDVCMERIGNLEPEDVARCLTDMRSGEGKTIGILDRFTSEELITRERERMQAKKK